jgi:TonB family protein
LGASGDADMTPTAAASSPIAPGITPPQLIKQATPDYPEDARQQRVQGRVVLELKIREDGHADELRAVDGNPVFYKSAMNCVKKWKFKPAMKDGNPVAVKINVEINYRLN